MEAKQDTDEVVAVELAGTSTDEESELWWPRFCICCSEESWCTWTCCVEDECWTCSCFCGQPWCTCSGCGDFDKVYTLVDWCRCCGESLVIVIGGCMGFAIMGTPFLAAFLCCLQACGVPLWWYDEMSFECVSSLRLFRNPVMKIFITFLRFSMNLLGVRCVEFGAGTVRESVHDPHSNTANTGDPCFT